MTLAVCIADLKAKGGLDAERADAYAAHYAELARQYGATMGEVQAAAAATKDTVEAIERELMEKRRQTLLQVAAQKTIVGNIVRTMAEGSTAAKAAIAHFDMEGTTRGIANLDARKRAILGEAHAGITELLSKFSHDLAGRTRNPAQLRNVVREAFGEATGDTSAAELAKAWAATADKLRKRFNAAGGHIAVRGDWGMPQAHLSAKVRQVSFEAWRDFIVPRLDMSRMVDGFTGKPFSAVQFELSLREAFNSIRSDGMDDMTPGGGFPPKLGNRRGEHRFFVFRDATTWMEYQQQFGLESPWDAMMGHIDGMARDIAQMEILGPSPNVTVRWLTDLLEKDVKASSVAGDRFTAMLNQAMGAKSQIKRMMGVFNGETNRPVNSTMARGFSTFRAMQTSAKLGGATISAVTDLGFQNVTARFNGLEYGNIIGNYVKLLKNSDDQDFAISSGLIAEEAASRMGSLWRYDDSVNTPEVARRLASGVLRASGLSAWTQAGKWAFGMEFMHALGRAAAIPFDTLDKGLRAALDRYGIGAADWEALRATPLYEHKGASYLRPDEVADQALRNRVLEMIQSETRFAVPEATLRARAVMTGGLQAGTASGELWRSVMQFKAFPVSIIMTHGLRMTIAKGPMSRAAYVANVMIATTAFGALALQMKDMIAGKDPRDMTTGKFWGAAFIQGGGAGLFGDLLYADTSRYGGNFEQTLLGPVAGEAKAIIDLTAGNLKEAAKGAETNFGSEAVQFAKANTPGASLWYGRLAFNRIFFDQVAKEIDPDAGRAFDRIEARARREMEQEYWWSPGEAGADRAPDFTAIDGGSL
ncbi:MAG: hypothetical protein ACOYLS_01275 [Polymorphobacter sp.]